MTLCVIKYSSEKLYTLSQCILSLKYIANIRFIRVFHIWIRIVKIKVNNYHSVKPGPRRRNAKRINPNFPRTANQKRKAPTAPNRAGYRHHVFHFSVSPGAPVYGGGEVSSGRPDRWASLLTRRKVTFQRRSRDKKEKAGRCTLSLLIATSYL